MKHITILLFFFSFMFVELAQAQTVSDTKLQKGAEALTGEGSGNEQAFGHVKVKYANTARGLIGREVVNHNDKPIARIQDLILDDKGQAKMAILSSGGFFGRRGKLVAVEYDALVSFNPLTNSLKLQPVAQDVIEKSAAFSYGTAEDGRNVNGGVLPVSGLSVARLLDGQLLARDGEKVADIEDIVIDRDHAEYLVVSVNELLDMGDKKAVIEFSGVELAESKKEINVKLSEAQVEHFGSFLEQLNQ